jgi:hypothetical protein
VGGGGETDHVRLCQRLVGPDACLDLPRVVHPAVAQLSHHCQLRLLAFNADFAGSFHHAGEGLQGMGKQLLTKHWGSSATRHTAQHGAS